VPPMLWLTCLAHPSMELTPTANLGETLESYAETLQYYADTRSPIEKEVRLLKSANNFIFFAAIRIFLQLTPMTNSGTARIWQAD
jgi:hypothetical protein